MSNHVHVVFTPLAVPSLKTDVVNSEEDTAQTKDLCYNTLSSIMQSLKGYTARKANRLLGRRWCILGSKKVTITLFGMQREWQRIIAYVVNNPVKAGLVDRWERWQWSYCRCSIDC